MGNFLELTIPWVGHLSRRVMLHVRPYGFVGIQLGGVTRQIVEQPPDRQFSASTKCLVILENVINADYRPSDGSCFEFIGSLLASSHEIASFEDSNLQGD
jgi:hypothetical protein